MTNEIREWTKQVVDQWLPSPGRVLEIGSLDVNGSVREYFTNAQSYLGTDMQGGPGVDMVCNAHDLIYGLDEKEVYQKFDTIICMETLEHDQEFWLTLGIIEMLSKVNSHLIITTPTFGFPDHKYPKDYWRFGEDAYREVFFAGYDILDLTHVTDVKGNPGICCIGKRRKYYHGPR